MNPAENDLTLNIRQAQIDDTPIIVQLIRELVEMEKESTPIDENYVAYYLSQPICHVLLADIEDQTIGLLSYMMKPDLFHGNDTCYISELVVTKSFRGHSVGSALMEHLIQDLKSTGCVEVSVSTMAHNQRAINFYKQHGFVDEGVLLERNFN